MGDGEETGSHIQDLEDLKKVLKSADSIVVISNELKIDLARRGITGSKITSF